MQNTIMGNALAEREATCNLPRIPSGRYPQYNETKQVTLDANGQGEIEFEADRDYLFYDLAIESSVAGDLATMRLSAEYCNTKILKRSAVAQWLTCCNGKPVFLQGVRDTKKLTFTITGGTEATVVSLSLAGFQGNGCCG